MEAGAGALGFLISGVSAVSLKLAMLGLWTIGVLFSFLALSKLLSINRSLWITAVLVVNPMWAAWSMKAGGGIPHVVHRDRHAALAARPRARTRRRSFDG